MHNSKGFVHLVLVVFILFIGLTAFGIYKSGIYNQFLSKINPNSDFDTGISYLRKEKFYLAGANFHNYLTKIKDVKNLDNKKKFIIGATFAQTGRYYQAIQLLENTSPDESDRIFYKTDYYNLLAESYLNKNKHDLAIQNADKALAIENATPTSQRKAHIIKFLAYKEKGDDENAKKQEETLGNLGQDDLDIFEREFYANRLLNLAQKSGILQQLVNKSFDEINQNQNLSPAKKAAILTILASFYRQNGNLTEAEFYAKKATEADPDYLPSYYEIGSIYYAQEKFHTALGYDHQITKIDPNHPMVLTAIGWNYYNLAVSRGDDNTHLIEVMKLAEKNFTKALEIDPEFAIALNNLGLVYYERNQCDRAVEKFNLAIKYDPTYPKPINNLGAVFYKAQDYSKAIEYFENSLKIKPDYTRAFLNIGRAYYYMGDFQKSLSALQQNLKLDPYDTDGYLFTAKNYLAQSKYQSAIETLDKAITIIPDYPKLYFALSEAYKSIGDVQKSKEAYEKFMSLFLMADSVATADAGETYANSEYIYYYSRGVEYKRDGKTDQAIEAFKKAIELQPAYTDSYIPLSRIYESKYGKTKAIELLQKGLKIAPESLSLYDELGYIYKDSGDIDSASKIFQEAIDKIKGNCNKLGVARIIEGLGLTYYDKKEFDLALDTFNKALEQDPKSSTIYTNLGATYTAKGDREKAIANLKKAIQINPNEALTHNNLGYALAQEGNIQEALAEFEKALKIDPNLKIAKENLARYRKR